MIETFRELTGIPMVLNTSFNENEPVVCKPQEALDCFLRTQMDVLVLGNMMLSGVTMSYEYNPSGRIGFGGWVNDLHEYWVDPDV